ESEQRHDRQCIDADLAHLPGDRGDAHGLADAPAHRRVVERVEQQHRGVADARECVERRATDARERARRGAHASSASAAGTRWNTRSRRASSSTARTASLTATRAKRLPRARAAWKPSTRAAMPDESM